MIPVHQFDYYPIQNILSLLIIRFIEQPALFSQKHKDNVFVCYSAREAVVYSPVSSTMYAVWPGTLSLFCPMLSFLSAYLPSKIVHPAESSTDQCGNCMLQSNRLQDGAFAVSKTFTSFNMTRMAIYAVAESLKIWNYAVSGEPLNAMH
jgi:hypothetical protein